MVRARDDGRLVGLTGREADVLELMARGLSNSAICRELHLSIKTVEPVISSIFAKLGLEADSTTNRRVLAVVAYLRPDSHYPPTTTRARSSRPRTSVGVPVDGTAPELESCAGLRSYGPVVDSLPVMSVALDVTW